MVESRKTRLTKMYYVYVLENENGRWYIGHTDNLKARVRRHNNQKVKSTKNRGVWRIIYKEFLSTRSEAMRREEYLKSGAGRAFIKKFLKRI